MMSEQIQIIEGEVRNQAGVPIINARVWISDGPLPTADMANLTDSDGRFSISVPQGGVLELTCAADGYETKSLAATVESGGATRLKFRLAPVS